MPRLVVLMLILLAPLAASAQTMTHDHMGMGMPPPGRAAAPTQPGQPGQPGQGAFAAIQEIVALLEADPSTDWSKVNIEALRQHLIDMDEVTLHAAVTSEPVAGGVKFTVTGAGPVKAAIQRMLLTHAATMNGVGGWSLAAAATDDGAVLTVLTPPKDVARLRALGFIGVLVRGMHHSMHHLMIARGIDPHP